MADGSAGRWFRARTRWQRMALALLAGGFAALGHAPFDLPVLTVLGCALAIAWASEAPSGRRAMWLGLVFGAGYFAVALHWIVEPFLVDVRRHGWMAPFALVFLSVGLSLFWAVAFWLGRAARVGPAGIVLAWGAAELVRAYVFTGFPWAMPSYVLVNGVGGQLAAWVGPHGVNLALFAVASLVFPSGRGRLPFAVAIALTVLAVWPVPTAAPPGSQASVVRLIQPNAPQHQKWDPDYMQLFFGRAIAGTAAGPDRPDLIVWPETAVPVSLNNATNTLDAIAEAAGGVPVVLGINRFDDVRIYNSAVVVEPTGDVSQVYDKHHLVPFGEYVPFGNLLARFGIYGLASNDGQGYSAGPGPGLLDLGGLGRALPLICYEVVFPQDVLGVPERPDLLLQITNDAWFGNFSGPYQHLQQARMRAIETGLPLIRVANTGVSAVVDSRGRVLAALPLNSAGHLDAAVPAPRAATPYARWGDWPLALLLVLACAALTLRARRNTD